jgi:hypothetical protein
MAGPEPAGPPPGRGINRDFLENRVTLRVTIHNNFIYSESFPIADRFNSVGSPLKMIALVEEFLEILNR